MNFDKTKKSFKQSLLAVALGAIAMSSLTISASETQERHVMIKIDKTDGDEAMVDLSVDGFEEVFSMPDLEVGESKTITTESGKTITLYKTEKGLSVEVDGKKIELPGLSGNLAAHIQRSMPLHTMVEDNVQISGVELDDNQKQIIQNAFIAAGIEKKISFSNKNIMIFQTGDKVLSTDKVKFIKAGDHQFNWSTDTDGKLEVIVNSDSDSEVQVHTKVIHIEEKEED